MTNTTRRSVLAAGIGVAAGLPLGVGLTGAAAGAQATADDTYPSNTALYRDTTLGEGTAYGRRYHRQASADTSLDGRVPFTPRTTVLAPHGGGIELGTSELCLAIAGFHPAELTVVPAGGPVHDYWMFEGLLSGGNAALHVTSTHCDDGIALALCAGSMNALAVHGCSPADAGLAAGAQAVLVGGANSQFKGYLIGALQGAGFTAIDAAATPALAGVSADNIVNRTMLGGGGQLEITSPLRSAMFEDNTRAGRAGSTTGVFWDFVAATRTAIAQLEAGQEIL